MLFLWSNRISPTQQEIVLRRSRQADIDPSEFMFLSEWESGLNPYETNPYGCFSWIQFCPSYGKDYKTINGRKYTFDELRSMDADSLLELSFDYLDEQIDNFGRVSDFYDLYFLILFPQAYGKSDDYVLRTKTNDVFDLNKNGSITVGEVKRYLDNRVATKVPPQYQPVFFKKKAYFVFTEPKLSLVA